MTSVRGVGSGAGDGPAPILAGPSNHSGRQLGERTTESGRVWHSLGVTTRESRMGVPPVAIPEPIVPEVLAPLGAPDTLEAARRGGADAVYFGLDGFNARARAANFRPDDLDELMQTLRGHGMRGYAALNTLAFDPEFVAVEHLVRACARAAVDAVIVQDLGVARLVREVAPDLPIHASTQMTCTDGDAIALAKSLGVTRVILPRELSLADIERLAADARVDLEVFVHGALCIAYSGQCLTSEAIGGRSANRGACAQACRLPYELVVDGQRRELDGRAFLLSPQDLDAITLVPDLVRIGVRALKIEGRLKGAEYVYRTARLYKKAVRAAAGLGEPPQDLEHRDVLQLFSRGSGTGYLLGVDHQTLVEGRTSDHRGVLLGSCEGTQRHAGQPCLRVRLEAPTCRGDGILVEGGLAGAGEIGGRIWNLYCDGRDVKAAESGATVLLWLGPDTPLQVPRADSLPSRRRVFKTSAAKPLALQDWEQGTVRHQGMTPLHLHLSGKLGEHPRLRARVPGGAACAINLDARIEQAHTAPISIDAIREKLGRLGGTPFVLSELDVDLPGGVTLPLSSLNRARRALVATLLGSVGASTSRTTAQSAAELFAQAQPTSRHEVPAGLFVLCRTQEQAEAALRAGATGVYLDFLAFDGLEAAMTTLRRLGSQPMGIALPRVSRPGEQGIDRHAQRLAPDAVLIRSLGSLGRMASSRHADPRPLFVGDFSLNVTNRLAAHTVLERGLAAFTPAYDLDSAQLLSLLDGALAQVAEVVVHQPVPLFHMEHCLFASLLSEGSTHATCGRVCERHRIELRDRTGRAHPVEADVGCRNTVFHAAAQTAIDVWPELLKCGVARFRVELLRESAAVAETIVAGYLTALRDGGAKQPVMTAMATLPGYPIVRGTLRASQRSAACGQ